MGEWVIQTGIVTVIGIIIGIISYFLKSFKADLDKKDAQLEQGSKELQQQIDDMQDEFHQYKLDAADKFVQKDDFIRATAVTDRKLDRIYDELMKMNKQMNTEVKS